MEQETIRRPGPSTKIPSAVQKATFILIILLFVAAASAFLYLLPGFETSPWGESTVLVIDNSKVGENLVRIEEREVLLNVEALQDYLDPDFFWDSSEQTAVITTKDRVIHMRSEALTAEVNLRPVELSFPLQQENGELYLPLLFLADFYGLDVTYHQETDTVVIDQIEKKSWLGRVLSDGVRLRTGPGLRHPYLTQLTQGEPLRLDTDEINGWTAVRTPTGLTGYLPPSSLNIEGPYPFNRKQTSTPNPTAPQIPPHPVIMTWEFAYTKTDVSNIGPMPSLQVLSPTWFHLNDSAGNMRNIADPAYVAWAHENGYLIWALVSNSFDPKLTGEVLSSSVRRRKVADQLLAYARLYNLDGLNIDFENFHYEYRDYFTQFVRELAPLCREEGLILSVDVTMISAEPYWSKGYDRAALAEAADYIILMAYDEHWENGPTPGSVASLPWVENGLQQVLKEVPPEKLILGVPFYTRLWQVENLAGGDGSISSRSYSMDRAEEILSARDYILEWDSRARQHTARYTEGSSTYQLWLEDAESMRHRLELVNRYSLAGIAGWRRGLETPDIWTLIAETLK